MKIVRTLCAHCCRLQSFNVNEIGPQCGVAWLSVHVNDGAAGSMLEAEFCSPACITAYFADQSNLETIRFPEPLPPSGK
jgi:hypothetical protein